MIVSTVVTPNRAGEKEEEQCIHFIPSLRVGKRSNEEGEAIFIFILNNGYHHQVFGNLQKFSLIFQQVREAGIFILHSFYGLEKQNSACLSDLYKVTQMAGIGFELRC